MDGSDAMMNVPIPTFDAVRKVPGIGALLLGLLLIPASADVFRRLGPARVPELNNGLHQWEDAYQTTMTVNGRPSEMRVYSVRYSEPVIEQLIGRFKALGARVSVARSPDGATGRAVWPGKEARFIVISPKSEPRHLVFVFYPEPGSRPSEGAFPVPKYTGSKTGYTVGNEKTGTFFAALSTQDSATSIHRFYATVLPGDGWTMVAPALVANGEVSGMAVYQKDKKVCYVQAVNRPGQANMVTLLVKGGKL